MERLRVEGKPGNGGDLFVAPTRIYDHTPGHHPGKCPPCDRVRDSMLTALSSSMEFTAAAEMFIAMRQATWQPGQQAARFVRRSTEKGYQRYQSSLALFFEGMTLGSIEWCHMHAYQQARVVGAAPFRRYRRPQDAKGKRLPDGRVLPAVGRTPCPAKPQQVNQELAFLKRLMKLAGCWTDEANRYYRELQEEEEDVPRSLTPEQQTQWLDTARAHPRWELLFHYSLVAFDTTMSTNELRGLRIGDVNLQHRLVNIPWPAAKNKYRRRTIAVESAETLWSLQWLVDRAQALGASDPQHALFPFRDNRVNAYLPAWHMTESGVKRLWQELREATGLTWFRPYDTRHTGATRLAESGVPVDVIMARMGHVSDRMRRHYTHISVQAQRSWLRGTPQGGYAPRGSYGGSYPQSHGYGRGRRGNS